MNALTNPTNTEGHSADSAAGPVLAWALAAYLLVVAGTACFLLISTFPVPPAPLAGASGASATPERSVLLFADVTLAGSTLFKIRGADQGLVVLALLAGLLGSFMHAAQSLAAFVGNRQLRASWALWYTLRPPIGGILGLLFYFILRAGLIPAATSANSDAISPYGVVAFAALAGWFSKRATDKLAEVFETLFRTAKDLEYKDKLAGNGKPKITSVTPAKIELSAHAGKDVVLVVTCEKLAPGATATLGGRAIASRPIGVASLACTIPQSFSLAPGTLKLVITNPPPLNAPPGVKGESSDPFEVSVE